MFVNFYLKNKYKIQNEDIKNEYKKLGIKEVSCTKFNYMRR